MTYPKNIPSVRDGLQSYPPPTGIADSFAAAISQPSPVKMIVDCYDLLKGAESLDVEGQKLLCGCAWLINTNVWFGKAEEALQTLLDVAPTLPANPEPEAPPEE